MFSWIKVNPGMVIFFTALVLRIAWVATLHNGLVWPDEEEFAEIARHLASGTGYVSNSYRANPVLPFYLSAFLRLFGENWLYPRIGQALIGALTCVILYRLASMLAGETVGILSGLLLALYPPQVYMSGVFYVECIATFLSMLSVYLVLICIRSPHPVAVSVFAGAVMGLTALTRAVFMPYVLVASLAMLYSAPTRRRTLMPAAAVLILAAVVVIAPWTLRNRTTFGRFLIISSGFGETLWKGNNELADGGADDRFMRVGEPLWETRLNLLEPSDHAELIAKYAVVQDQIRDRYAETNDLYLARDDVLGPLAAEVMRKHPVRTTGLFARKLLTLFHAFSDTKTHNQFTSGSKRLVAAVTFYPILALAFVGLILAAPRHRSLAPVYSLVFLWFAIHGLLTACTRFRLPMDPFLILFACVALERFGQRILSAEQL
jgi:4-amino-4-deoxy-L-arabinose transferase and related glycosyltransferases of PMT family